MVGDAKHPGMPALSRVGREKRATVSTNTANQNNRNQTCCGCGFVRRHFLLQLPYLYVYAAHTTTYDLVTGVPCLDQH